MKLKSLYEKVFSLSFFKKLLDVPVLGKLLSYEILSYLFFGVLTTVVNFVVYGLMNALLRLIVPGVDTETHILFTLGRLEFKWIYLANGVAWFLAALFAFIVNKVFVFEAKEKDSKTLAKELASFFGARVLSLILFEELLFAGLSFFMNSWIAKIISSVANVVFNYVASKFVIFRKKGEGKDA